MLISVSQVVLMYKLYREWWKFLVSVLILKSVYLLRVLRAAVPCAMPAPNL